MPKLVTPLTDVQVENAKAKDKPYKLFDGGGLYLEVMPTGLKLWHMKFHQANGKKRRLSFGSYPAVSLTAACSKRSEAKEIKAKDIDPAQANRLDKLQKAAAASNTFEAAARQWHGNKREAWKENTVKEALNRLEKDVFPLIGKRPMSEIDAPLMLDVLRRVEQRGAQEVAARLVQLCSQIFRYAIASGLAKYNPVPDLRGALKPRFKGHHAAITTDELTDFLKVLEKNEARIYAPMRILMRLMMLVFVRTSELIETPWSEIDLENEQWVIPWQRMKMGKKKVNPRKVDHHVNMPRQGWELLRELHAITGRSKYLLPGQEKRHVDRRHPMDQLGPQGRFDAGEIPYAANKGEQAILLKANAEEAAVLGKAMPRLPGEQRLPMANHRGVTGGDLPQLVGPDIFNRACCSMSP